MRIKHLGIQGFRSFGPNPAEIDLDNAITILEGDNSHGKTSIAEALEFLLTGDITRRAMAGSALDEFEGCLRNAHMDSSIDTYVEADFREGNGEPFRVRRTLTADVGRSSSAESVLTASDEQIGSISSVGITLSAPPIEAPILLQHNIRYLLTARPQERMDYFKAVLELSDVERVRGAISRLEAPTLSDEVSDLLSHLSELVGDSSAPAVVGIVQAAGVEAGSLEDGIRSLVAIFLTNEGIGVSENPDEAELNSVLRAELNQRRDAIYPLDDLSVPLGGAEPPTADTIPIEEYNAAVDAADQSLSQLLGLFEELLHIPAVAEATQAIDCPVCETPLALTPERVTTIQRHVDSSSGLTEARTRMERAISSLKRRADGLRIVARAIPASASWDEAERERRIAEAEAIANSGEDLRAALDEIATLRSAAQALHSRSETALNMAGAGNDCCAKRRSVSADLPGAAMAMDQAAAAFEAALATFEEKVDPVRQSLSAAMSQRSDVAGLKSALGVLDHLGLIKDLGREVDGIEAAKRNIRAAQEDMDSAVQTLLDRRFTEMSDEIARWWTKLRPGDPTSFEQIERRGTGRRYVSLKTKLGNGDGNAGGVVRDAVAVLSDSQLGALGVSTFLARCIAEGTGFLLVDDPLAGFDDEHRSTFANETLGGLADAGVQVIVITYDRRLAEEIQVVHGFRGVGRLNVILDEPAVGTLVTTLNDPFEELHAAASSLSRSGHPGNRRMASQYARTASERLAKQIIVGHQCKAGRDAHISDFEGHQLSSLIDTIADYVVTEDELGKWRAIPRDLNPGSHDAPPPLGNTLAQALGNLRRFQKNHKAELGEYWPGPE